MQTPQQGPQAADKGPPEPHCSLHKQHDTSKGDAGQPAAVHPSITAGTSKQAMVVPAVRAPNGHFKSHVFQHKPALRPQQFLARPMTRVSKPAHAKLHGLNKHQAPHSDASTAAAKSSLVAKPQMQARPANLKARGKQDLRTRTSAVSSIQQAADSIQPKQPPDARQHDPAQRKPCSSVPSIAADLPSHAAVLTSMAAAEQGGAMTSNPGQMTAQAASKSTALQRPIQADMQPASVTHAHCPSSGTHVSNPSPPPGHHQHQDQVMPALSHSTPAHLAGDLVHLKPASGRSVQDHAIQGHLKAMDQVTHCCDMFDTVSMTHGC